MSILQSNGKPAAADREVDRRRDDFPALRQEVHGKPLIYFDSAATAQKPQAVLDVLAHYYAEDNANVHRAVHTLSQRATAGSAASFTVRNPGKKYDDRTGVTVSATTSEAKSAMRYESPSGRRSRPSTPLRKKSGRSTSITIRVAKTIEPRTSALAP